MKPVVFLNICIAMLVMMLNACTATQQVARPGEQVLFDYTCRLIDDSLVETTLAQVAGNKSVAKSTIFALRDNYRPVQSKVPDEHEPVQFKPLDPLEQKISVSLSRRLRGVSLDQPITINLESAEIDNFPAGDRYLTMARRFNMPRTGQLSLQNFNNRFGKAALVKDSVVGDDTSFPGRIVDISDTSVTIHYSVRNEPQIMPMPLGSAFIRIKDDKHFEATMDVHKGQLFKRVGGLPGRIISVDEDKYVIDFGQTFAGENLYCQVTTRLHDPELTGPPAQIDWVENFDQAIAQAREQHKPVVLMLYSDQCPHCHQMLDKVIPDPALDSYRDGFVWLKINSEKQTEYADRFQQQGYPLTLVLDANASELKRLSGLQHIATLAHTLDTVLAAKKKS